MTDPLVLLFSTLAFLAALGAVGVWAWTARGSGLKPLPWIPLVLAAGLSVTTGLLVAVDLDWTTRTVPFLLGVRSSVLLANLGLLLAVVAYRADLRRRRILAVQHAVASALAQSATLVEASPGILRGVCGIPGWIYGAIWTVDEGAQVLRCVDSWHPPGADVAAFDAETRARLFPPGIGLPGRIWTTAAPAWIRDVVRDTNFPRASHAARCGLHGAFGLPILGPRREVLGVLEFFSASIRQPDEELLSLLADLGDQIGQYLVRRRAEEAVLETERRYADLIRFAPDPVILLDPAGRFTAFNPAAERLSEWSAAEVLERPFAEVGIIAPDSMARTLEEFTRTLEGEERPPFELDVRARGGGTLVMEAHARRIRRGMDVVGVEVTFRDITHRREIERMKNEFVSLVSHELRTPLTSILGSLGLIDGGAAGPVPPPVRDLVDIAKRNSQTLLRLINDILDLDKIESGRMPFVPRTVELSALLAQAIEVGGGFAASRGVAVRLADGLPRTEVHADPDRLMQVVANLLSNAVKFSPPAGEVEVSSAHRGDLVRVAVSDRGAGVPAEFRARLFEKFAQADGSDARRRGGSGLGLSICKAIVERLGGTVGFEERPGGGASFWFELPRLPREKSAATVPCRQSLHVNAESAEEDGTTAEN